MESARQIDDEERCARKAFDGGDQNALDIVALLEKVTKPDQSPLYYSGGLRIVADVLNNSKRRLLYGGWGVAGVKLNGTRIHTAIRDVKISMNTQIKIKYIIAVKIIVWLFC